MRFDIYTPTGFDGNANIYVSRLATLSGGFEQGIFLFGNGTAGTFGDIDTGTPATLLRDQWVPVTVDIDLGAGTAVSTYGGSEVYNGSWLTEGGSASQYQGINIWANGGALVEAFYIDNLTVDVIPEPSASALLGLSFLGLILRRCRS